MAEAIVHRHSELCRKGNGIGAGPAARERRGRACVARSGRAATVNGTGTL